KLVGFGCTSSRQFRDSIGCFRQNSCENSECRGQRCCIKTGHILLKEIQRGGMRSNSGLPKIADMPTIPGNASSQSSLFAILVVQLSNELLRICRRPCALGGRNWHEE